MKLYEQKIALLQEIADEIRKTAAQLVISTHSKHLKNTTELAEVFAVLYFYALQHNPQKPQLNSRDRVILSDKIATPLYYAALAYADYFSREELSKWRTSDASISVYPMQSIRQGIEATILGGGLGLGEAAGIALAARLDETTTKTYCILGDEEHSSGALWESAMFIGNNRLSNCITFVNRNGLQKDGATEQIVPLESLKAKYESFGFQVLEIDGHNIEAIIAAILEAHETREKPTVIIAHTIPANRFDEYEVIHTQ